MSLTSPAKEAVWLYTKALPTIVAIGILAIGALSYAYWAH